MDLGKRTPQNYPDQAISNESCTMTTEVMDAAGVKVCPPWFFCPALALHVLRTLMIAGAKRNPQNATRALISFSPKITNKLKVREFLVTFWNPN